MPNRFKVSGFDDSVPSRLPAALSDPFEQTIPHQEDAHKALTDRRLFSLYRAMQLTFERHTTLEGAVKKTDEKVDAMSVDMKKNNEMTEKILIAVSSGKFIVGVIKFVGAIAAPIGAIVALWWSFKTGTPPPKP